MLRERIERARADEPAEVVSPELVLVDPELARVARERLADVPRTPSSNGGPAPSAPTAPERTGRRRFRRRLGLTLAAVLVAAGAVAAALVLGRGSSHSAARATTHAAASTQTTERSTPRTHPKAQARLPLRGAAGAKALPTFVWAPVRGARRYQVQFFRAGRPVFTARTTRARVVLPRQWTVGGKRYHLKPGLYRWYVWPIFGSRSSPKRGKAVVQASVRLEK